MSPSLIAIDPGASGGIAILADGAVSAFRLPAIGDLGTTLSALAPIHAVYIEDVPFAFSRGTRVNPASLAKLQRGLGQLEGFVMGRGLRLVGVRPMDWQARLGLGGKRAAGGYAAWKKLLKLEAARRFPDLAVTLATADALLILEYAREKENIS